MKINFLIVDKNYVEKHIGEEYNDYLEVDAIVEAKDIPAVASVIRNKIRQIIIDADAENGGPVERKVCVFIDASPVYGVIVVSLSDIMAKEEKIELLLGEEYDVKNRIHEKVDL